MAKGRLYQAFVNAKLKREAISLCSGIDEHDRLTGLIKTSGIGYHIAVYDNITPNQTPAEHNRALNSTQKLTDFLKNVRTINPKIILRPTKNESIIDVFLNKYAPTQT